jgi:hypothetical protein
MGFLQTDKIHVTAAVRNCKSGLHSELFPWAGNGPTLPLRRIPGRARGFPRCDAGALPFPYDRFALVTIAHSRPLTGARGFENERLDSG